MHPTWQLFFKPVLVLVSLPFTMAAEVKGATASTSLGQDMATTATWTSPSPTTSPSKERAYRKHMRKESEASAKAQHDALMDDYHAGSPPRKAQPSLPPIPTQSDQAHAQNGQSSTQEEASNAKGFGKLLQKIGLKK